MMTVLAAFNGTYHASLASAASTAVSAMANATAAAASNGTLAKAAKAGGLAAIKLNWQGGVVIATLAIALVVMGFDAIGPDLVFGALASLYMVAGIISTKEGASGFSNTGVLTVMVLYVVAEGVSQTGGLDILMNRVLGRANSVFWAQTRMMIPVMISSAFLNNTPIVALLIPILLSWSHRCNVPAKKLLIPLSYATVLGGTVTIIGTSTNLVVSGLQQEMSKDDPSIPVFGFFTITPYGLPYAIWGMAYILLFSWMLPGHEGAGHTDLTSELLVTSNPKDVHSSGQSTLAGSGLYDAVGTCRPVGVRSGAAPAVPAVPGGFVAKGDVIIVEGSAHDIQAYADANSLQLLHYEGSDAGGDGIARGRDAGALEAARVSDSGAGALAEVTVAANSSLIGANIRDLGFRGRFDAAVIAVKRGSVRQAGRLGDVVLRKGDVLVLSAGANFDAATDDFKANFKKLHYLDQTVQREYVTAMRVTGPPVAGKTIAAAGLRGVTGLYLFEVRRADGTILRAVEPTTTLLEGDLLYFAGDIASVSFLMKFDGLASQQHDQVNKLSAKQVDRSLVQAVVSPHSPLAHVTAREARFRHTYGAALLSVHRAGSTVTGDVADVKLQPGDVLVLEAGPEFAKVFTHNPAFALISHVPNSEPVKRNRMWIALAIVAALIATQIAEGATGKDIVHLWPASVLAAGLMLLTRCMSTRQARAAMDWEVYTTIAFAFAVSSAMEKTKVALAIAELFAALSHKIGGGTAALTSMYVVTALLSELLTNNAAAAIMFPIAAALAKSLGVSMNMMSIAVMLGGSAGWILPYSYQCNLMVYAAGGYRTVDFVRFGTLFHPWLLVGVVLILGSGEKFYIPLIASAAFVAVVIAVPLIYGLVLSPSRQIAVSQWASGLLGRRRGGSAGGSHTVLAGGPSPDAKRARDQKQVTGGTAREW